MKTQSKSIRYALRMFVAIGIFFILTNLLGLGDISELRIMNLFIIIYFTSKLALNNIIDNEKISYVSNLSSLFAANMLTVVFSMIGLGLFVAIIDPNYVAKISNGILLAQADTLGKVIASLFIEGMAGAAVVSFGVMQYWKNYKRVHRTLASKEEY